MDYVELMGTIELTNQSLKEALQKKGLLADIQKTTEESEHEQLVVPLTPDLHERGRVLLVNIFCPPFSKERKTAPKEEELNIQFLQFFVPLPIQILESQLSEMMHLFNMLNTVSELPGFVIAEKDLIPLFHYNMTCTNNRVDEELFVMTVGLILYVLENYTDIIDKIATGEKKLSELMKESDKL